MYIDKTKCLEKGIQGFPSIYIMGASATGKSVAVKMFFEKYPEKEYQILDMQDISREEFEKQIEQIMIKLHTKEYCLVLDNIQAKSEFDKLIEEFIMKMPETGRVILVGRESLPEALLPLLWKRKLEIIPQEALAFSKEEVRRLGEITGSLLNADEVWKCTGGWAGCVDLMMRLSANGRMANDDATEMRSVEGLRKSYEVNTYIEKFLIGSLPEEERILLEFVRKCLWVNVKLCMEVGQINDAEALLENMTRKGFFLYNKRFDRWKIAPLFDKQNIAEEKEVRKLGEWYEKNNYLKEALRCFAMVANPDSYLRGIQCYQNHDFNELDQEIMRLEKLEMEDDFFKRELLLNLYYLKPDFPLVDWLAMLEEKTKEIEDTGRKFRLYGMLGSSCTYLCGIRDLTELFACTKREENRRAKIWKNGLGEREWIRYRYAKVDYYLETERHEEARNEWWDIPSSGAVNPLARLYLLGKMQRIFRDEEYAEQFQQEGEELMKLNNFDNREIAEALIMLHSPWLETPEKLTHWLKNSEQLGKAEITEKNCCILWFLVNGYLILGQYKKAERILKHLIPYLKMYRRQKFLAEAYFDQAIIDWELNRHSQALKAIMESFYISSQARYVGFYISYGKRGKEVLEAYEEWNRKMAPEVWGRKKKYHYGNVLRMPVEDYISFIIRGVQREVRNGQPFQLETETVISEHLTMMETIILQGIGRGLSNSEICQEQNLKLPTVKSHIYSMYKKLGVNSRVQAIIKGKEMGLLD